METKEPFTAAFALQTSRERQSRNFQDALLQIKGQSELGFQECLIHVMLNFQGISDLMQLGFGVAKVQHPFEQRELIKISW